MAHNTRDGEVMMVWNRSVSGMKETEVKASGMWLANRSLDRACRLSIFADKDFPPNIFVARLVDDGASLPCAGTRTSTKGTSCPASKSSIVGPLVP